MANLYPASISNHPDIPESEKQVFEKLKLLDDTDHVFRELKKQLLSLIDI